MYWPLLVMSLSLSLCAGTIGNACPELAWLSPMFSYGAGATMILGLRFKLPDDFPFRYRS